MALTLEFKAKPMIMKKLFLITAWIACTSVFRPADAQVVQVNLVSQPIWGPVGYDYVEYYYLPDIETYYYVPRRQFVYFNNGQWIFVSALPARYRAYNLYSGYKVVINGPRPYLLFTTHKVKYAKFKGNNGKQIIIRNSNDPKYFVVKGHPKYNASGKSKTVTAVRTNTKANVKPASGNVKNNSQAKSSSKGGGKGKGKN